MFYKTYSMDSMIDEYLAEEEKRRGVKLKDEPEDKEYAAAEVKKNREQYALLQKKYDIERMSSHGDPTDFSDYPTDENGNIDYKAEEPIRKPMNDVLSGTCVTIRYGEGILDFVYADLVTPMKERYAMYRLFRKIREKGIVDLSETEPAIHGTLACSQNQCGLKIFVLHAADDCIVAFSACVLKSAAGQFLKTGDTNPSYRIIRIIRIYQIQVIRRNT